MRRRRDTVPGVPPRPAPPPHRPPRSEIPLRDTLVFIAAGLVAVGAVAGGIYLVVEREQRDPLAEATAVIDAYAEAWEQRELEAMRPLVAPGSEGFTDAHRDQWEALAPEAIEISRSPVALQGTQADAELEVTVTLPRADAWTYATDLTVTRHDGEWLVQWDPSTLHPDLEVGFGWEVRTRIDERAPILARDGTPVTGPGTVHQIGIEPRRLDEEDLLAALAEVLPDALEDAEALLARDDLQPTWFYPLTTVDDRRFRDVWGRLGRVSGVIQREQPGRVRFGENFALHVIGRVGELTAEQLEDLGPPYEPGDEAGLYGLERRFQDQLTGGPAIEVAILEPDGDLFEIVHESQSDPSAPVETTLDTTVQEAVENALVGVSEPTAIVAVDPATGAVRGSASRPLGGYNRAWEGRYPPGSTFKVVTAEALLSAGIGPGEEVACPAETVIGGLRVPNAGGRDLGTVPFATAVAESCNTTFASLAAEALEGGELDAAAGRFGFGADYELALPAAGGSFPPPVDLAERAAAAFGQGRVEASPLHMASVMGAVVSGTWRSPHILAGAGEDATATPSAGVLPDLRELLRRVVTDGTGTAAAVTGVDLLGKTGTAESQEGVEHAWFLGATDELAFAVLVEGGGSGGEVAAPLAARFLRELEAGAG